ncbi:MAG TPA: hypothetical protein VHF69_15055 [Candidatus Synoicihabitans sp.]|nr:hypothetical protein [Candidatus Synoicihabitans sp.]
MTPSAPTPPPLPDVSHSPRTTIALTARTSVLERPRTYLVTSSALVVHPPDAGPASSAAVAIRWQDIVQIRLRYFPTRVQPGRHECLLRIRPGMTWKITNEYYEGPMQFRDQSAAYRAFVTAVVTRLMPTLPPDAFLRGTTAAGYFGSLAFCIAMFLLAAGLLLTLGPASPTIVVLKLALIVCYLPMLVRYARRNRPRTFDPTHIPADILPPDHARSSPPG